MTDRASRLELLARARSSSDLGLRAGRTGDADLLLASGLSARSLGPLAQALPTLLAGPTTEELEVAVRAVANLARALGRRRGWRLHERTVLEVASTAVRHYCEPACPHCRGTGRAKITSLTITSSRICGHCHGTSQRQAPHRIRQEVQQVVDAMMATERVLVAALARSAG